MTRAIFVLVFLALTACGDSDFVKCVEGMDDLDLNIESCTRAMEADGLPDEDLAKILNSRGSAYYYNGEYNRAIADFDESIWLIPSSAVAYFNRGWAHSEKSEYNRAIKDFDEAIRLGGDDANYVRGRVMAYYLKGEYYRAIEDLDQAIRLKPDDANAMNTMAWILATARNTDVRDGHEAVRLAQEAVRLIDAPAFRDTLAAAYAEAGQFDNAVAAQERAIEMLRTAGRDDEVADYQNRLDLYRYGQPYRE